MPRQSTSRQTTSTRSNSGGNSGRKLGGSSGGTVRFTTYTPTRSGAGQHSTLSKSR